MRELYARKGKWARKRSPENVIEEIKQASKKYKMKVIRFPDDTFTLDKKWLLKFLKLYKEEVFLPFTCNGRANELNEPVVKALKESNCINLFFGVETGNDWLRNTILKRGISKSQIIDAARLLKKYKIKFGVYNMFGLPSESIEMAFETIHLNRKIKPNYPSSTIFQPYPKMEITEYAYQKGLIQNSDINNISIMNQDSVIRSKETDRLVNIQRFFYLLVRFPFLTPIIKQLIKLPPNKIYKSVSDLFNGFSLANSFGLDVLTSVKLGFKLRNKI
jgi:radical SAM superfamily enzyme YgiQ (UPF0313 family)